MENTGRSDKPRKHKWKFRRVGGFHQVRLEEGADLAALDELDQKLWVALSCPTQGLDLDTGTLGLIDTDKDGRIRVPEVRAAVRWACSLLRDPGQLLAGSPSLPLEAINDQTPEGLQVLHSARHILSNLGKADAVEISVEDTAGTERIFAQTVFNGDGVIPAGSADAPEVKAVIADIMACLGPERDRSGQDGVNQAKVDTFFAQAQAYADWWAQASQWAAKILPLGEKTAAAAAALAAVRAKIEDYFTRCRLVAFDARALGAMNRSEADYAALAGKELSNTTADVAALPMARIEAGRPLPLRGDVSPAWTKALAALRDLAVEPLLGARDGLSEKDWHDLLERFAPYEAWVAAKAGSVVEKLTLPRVQEILAGPAREALTALIAKDKALEPEANAIATVDRLVRYNRDLVRLLTNFVSFAHFYSGDEPAAFQTGALYLDQRRCDLCVRVDDPAKHAAMAHLSNFYLAYCDLTHKSTGEKMTIAAAFTAGDSDNLMAGRNGVFYDRKGQDWDATITRVVDNPISIRQAFWSPYKKLSRWISDQIAKRAAAHDAAATNRLTSHVTDLEKSAQAGKAPEPKPKFDLGVIAVLGVVISGLTAAVAQLTKAMADMTWSPWAAFGIPAIFVAISTPSMILAGLKLRQRNLGPLLDANGWAVNAKAKIGLWFGRRLTSVAKRP
ncbi:MAG: hypothetical protein NTV86_05975 [Planctomycetota bacterium]|nr:hypothetical protein [Planctomycetota bacterium]